MIDEKIIKDLLNIYDEKNEFLLNDRYSTQGWQMVFTKPDDNNHWLVFQKKSKDEIEVHRTDETGFITERDIYRMKDNKLNKVISESYNRDIGKVSIRDNLSRCKELSRQRHVNAKMRGVQQYEI